VGVYARGRASLHRLCHSGRGNVSDCPDCRHNPTLSGRGRLIRRRAGAILLALLAAAGARAEEGLAPEDWVAATGTRCDAERQAKLGAIARLRASLADSAQSESELDLADEECQLLAQAWAQERKAAFERLDFLLDADKMTGLAKRVRALREAAELTEPRRGHYVDPFVDALELLLATATPCEISAFEATLLLEAYGQPLDPGPVDAGLDCAHALAAVHEAQEAAHESTGSAAIAFAHLRPAAPDLAFPATTELLRTLARSRAAYARPIAAGASCLDVPAALAAPVREPANSAAVAHAERALIGALGTSFRLAAEAPRIRSYLHERIDELEGALRINVPDAAANELFAAVADSLVPDARALTGLARISPEEIAALMAPQIDDWLQETALPAVMKRLEDEPVIASWYFVQTGTLAHPARAYDRSTVPIPPGTAALDALPRAPFDETITALRHYRVPDSYVEAFVALESQLTMVTATRHQALAAVMDPHLRSQDLDRLREYFGENATVSTLDVYRFAIRDANRIDGAVDWQLIAAALRGLTAVKREALSPLVATAAGSDPDLASYLQTAGDLTLEMEADQATDHRFQERTGGAFVGTLLHLFAMSDGVPTALWAPGGVTGEEFAALVDGLTLENQASDRCYTAKQADDVQLVLDGREYHQALSAVIDSADSFLNLSAFDWKHDPGGQEIAYRLMAKKLGIDAERFTTFRERFGALPLRPEEPAPLRFYDIPPDRMKNLLIYEHFTTTDQPAVAAACSTLRAALGGGDPPCATVEECGDLSALEAIAGTRYDRARAAHDSAYSAAWRAFQAIEALFAEDPPALERTHPQPTLAAYFAERSAVHRYVRRYGLRRADRPNDPFPIHAVTDGKQAVSNVHWWQPTSQFPFFFHDPFRSLFHPMQEFDVELIFWKGFLEFPWHVGPVPIPGRMIAGVIPMPFIPYPWLNNVPGFTWAGPGMSLFLQYLLAADPRVWWGMAAHSKSVSNERMALESGMGMAAKYMNAHPELKTWHDTGIVVTGPIVNDVNDHFVQVFNDARVNNQGGPESRGLTIEKLDYADYMSPAPAVTADPPAEITARSWVLTTYPEGNDYNYRGIFMAALAAARKNIYIENAFFSDPLVAHMLVRKAREFRARMSCEGRDPAECAALREEGVPIVLIVPDSSDKPIIDAVGTADFHEMLHLGVKIYRWNPSAGWSARKSLHSKAWLVDYEPGAGGLAYVGSANATQRSHVADNEVGILTTNAAFADSLYERLFTPDMLVDARRESPEHFHVVQARPAVRASNSLRKLLVSMFWFF
jgi:phosphatidylserine/phosphatidylglycerophosphate/cardiolipin synthase-like enzyme